MMPTEEARFEGASSSSSNNSSTSLRASRVLGSFRQLWSDDDDDEQKSPSYVLRPESTRDVAGLAAALDSDEMQRILANTNQIPDCISHNVSSACFQKDYPTDASLVPLVIKGCEDGGIIRPSTEWTMDSLVDILGKDRRLEVAKEDATVSVQEYVNYLNSDGVKKDDDPVLIFETLIDGEHDCMIDRYSIPPCLWGGSENKPRTGCHASVDRSDLLSAAGNDGHAFGTHRWMIIGPKNSGSNIHIDPLATSAWNMLLIGRKLWILFPPDIDESELKSAANLSTNESKEDALDFCAAGWMVHVLSNLSDDVYSRRVQFVQQEGETIFVPEGWWHVVLNLETTLAVTQNFGHPHSYEKVSSALFEADYDAACTWKRNAAH
mmetsp:Transcript_22791/g.33772  ORF Transcript_22791/g.33772 Transcript_22791/m.33772 type:complete len:379 (-) Transcript_22791:56-1192(-)